MGLANVLNRITRSIRPGSVFESAQNVIDSTVSYNQGDLLVFDDTNNLVAKASAEADGATFLGIATETIVSGKLKRPVSTDVDASAAISDVPGPMFGVVAKLALKTGDSLSPGDLVYLYPTGGSYHIQASGTKAVGVYQGSAVTGGPSDTPTLVEVHLGHRFPGDSLQF